jgi:hypothetical protein
MWAFLTNSSSQAAEHSPSVSSILDLEYEKSVGEGEGFERVTTMRVGLEGLDMKESIS